MMMMNQVRLLSVVEWQVRRPGAVAQPVVAFQSWLPIGCHQQPPGHQNLPAFLWRTVGHLWQLSAATTEQPVQQKQTLEGPLALHWRIVPPTIFLLHCHARSIVDRRTGCALVWSLSLHQHHHCVSYVVSLQRVSLLWESLIKPVVLLFPCLM